MRQTSNIALPEDKRIFYDAEDQEFVYAYDNGGMMVTGNHLSSNRVPLEDVVMNLLNRISNLEYELKKMNQENDYERQ